MYSICGKIINEVGDDYERCQIGRAVPAQLMKVKFAHASYCAWNILIKYCVVLMLAQVSKY